MNLFLISQVFGDEFEVYNSAVVCAETEAEARMVHPMGDESWNGKREGKLGEVWCDAKDVQVKIIGAAARNIGRGVILASYNTD